MFVLIFSYCARCSFGELARKSGDCLMIKFVFLKSFGLMVLDLDLNLDLDLDLDLDFHLDLDSDLDLDWTWIWIWIST